MSLWVRAVVGLAGAKSLTAVVAIVVAQILGPTGDLRSLPWVPITMVLGYGGVAATLLLGGSSDSRARTLGVFLLLIASAFSDVLATRGHPLGGLSGVAASIRVDALLPYFLWLFARDFPVTAMSGRLHMFTGRVTRVVLGLGLVLWAVNTAIDLGAVGNGSPGRSALTLFSRRTHVGTLYWPTLFAMMLPAVPVLVARARDASGTERRRMVLFVSALFGGLVPITLDVVLTATSDAWVRFTSRPAVGWTVEALVVFALLSVPFTTSYSVLVQRVLDVRILIRIALQYALARYSVLALVSLPFVWLAWFVFENRHGTVQDLLLGRPGLILVIGVAFGVATLGLRKKALTALDKRYFREQYDAERILSGIVEAARHADSTARLATLLGEEIDRTLHIEHVAVLVRNAQDSHFVASDSSIGPLPVESLVVRLLMGSDEPMDVDVGAVLSPVHRLDAEERRWLSDGRFKLAVPLRDADGVVVGILALGEKRSRVPYTEQDRRLLKAVGASGGIWLGSRRARETPPRTPSDAGAAPPSGDDKAALECLACGAVYTRPREVCTCRSRLTEAAVPCSLAGKFVVEGRLGAGGMGVVYRARDMALGRTVALKTLPRVSPGRVERLRREARAMASVTHPNLEFIYGLESWRDRPVLVVEYLAGGTLKDRLTRGPLPVSAMATLGLSLADALEALHARGLLHRDIKPSNIGYSVTGAAKLLDFGVAKLFDAETESVPPDTPDPTPGADTTATTGGDGPPTTSLIGTPPYMAPEALRKEPPGPSFDLWGLAVVLYEALSGVNPFHGATLLETLARIQSDSPPDARLHIPNCPGALAGFFATVLAPDRRIRPATSREFRECLAGVSQVSAAPQS
jgi:hypothetical protein